MILQENKINGQFFITLPKVLVNAKGWKGGQKLEIRFNERGNLELEDK